MCHDMEVVDGHGWTFHVVWVWDRSEVQRWGDALPYFIGPAASGSYFHQVQIPTMNVLSL